MKPDAVTLLGLTAAFLTTLAFVPQAVKIIRTRHTKDLSLWMYVLLNIGLILWLAYGFILRDPALILANSITFILTFIILILKIKNG